MDGIRAKQALLNIEGKKMTLTMRYVAGDIFLSSTNR